MTKNKLINWPGQNGNLWLVQERDGLGLFPLIEIGNNPIREVNKADFFNAIKPLNVHPKPLGNHPFPSIWVKQDSTQKIVGVSWNHKYFLIPQKEIKNG